MNAKIMPYMQTWNPIFFWDAWSYQFPLPNLKNNNYPAKRDGCWDYSERIFCFYCGFFLNCINKANRRSGKGCIDFQYLNPQPDYRLVFITTRSKA